MVWLVSEFKEGSLSCPDSRRFTDNCLWSCSLSRRVFHRDGELTHAKRPSTSQRLTLGGRCQRRGRRRCGCLRPFPSWWTLLLSVGTITIQINTYVPLLAPSLLKVNPFLTFGKFLGILERHRHSTPRKSCSKVVAPVLFPPMLIP